MTIGAHTNVLLVGLSGERGRAAGRRVVNEHGKRACAFCAIVVNGRGWRKEVRGFGAVVGGDAKTMDDVAELTGVARLFPRLVVLPLLVLLLTRMIGHALLVVMVGHDKDARKHEKHNSGKPLWRLTIHSNATISLAGGPCHPPYYNT